MVRKNLERYLWILNKNLWISQGINIIVAACFLLAAPLMFGMNDLNRMETARVMEQYASIIGIILVVPVFRPEGDKAIREVIEAKYTTQTAVSLIRILQAIAFLGMLLCGFLGWMILQQSEAEAVKYLIGTLGTAMFLGSLGLLVYGVSDQILLGYMVPVGYVMLNLFSGDTYVKKFYLYSLMKNGSMTEKYYLLAASAIMLMMILLYQWLHSRLR